MININEIYHSISAHFIYKKLAERNANNYK